MNRSGFSEEQIVGVLEEAEAGVPVVSVVPAWAGSDVHEARRATL